MGFFYKLMSQDKSLACGFGRISGNPILVFLQELRDKASDELLQRAAQDNEECEDGLRMCRGRHVHFSEQIVSLDIPEIADRTRHTMRVLTALRKKAPLEFELNGVNLKYLVDVLGNCREEEPRPRPGKQKKLSPMFPEYPHVFECTWDSSCSGRGRATCWYSTEDGKQKRLFKRIRTTADTDTLGTSEGIRRQVAATLEAKRKELHFGEAEDSEEDVVADNIPVDGTPHGEDAEASDIDAAVRPGHEVIVSEH